MEKAKRPKVAIKRAPWLLDYDTVCGLYARLTMSEIAQEHKVGMRAVVWALKHHKIERRARGERPPEREDSGGVSCNACPERELCYTPGHICVCAPERRDQ